MIIFIMVTALFDVSLNNELSLKGLDHEPQLYILTGSIVQARNIWVHAV